MSERRIHIVDDEASIRRSLGRLLASVGYETAVYASASALLKNARNLTTGCVLLNVRMPRMEGTDVQQRLMEKGIRLPVIVLTAQGDAPAAVSDMTVGDVVFIEKPFTNERLFRAIESALVTAAASDWNQEAATAAKRIAVLSPRERAVLDALMSGHANKRIAHDLGISVRTVEAHRARMLHRLETHGLAEAVRLAVLATLVRPGMP